jgi:Ca-activated chloride channel family protein
MRLSTLVTASATGMAATCALVWAAVDPAAPRAASAAQAAADQPVLAARPDEPAAALPDRSHFQAGKTLTMEGRLGHRVLPAGADSETYLFVDVAADRARAATIPAALNLAIVIDRSGSMKGKRLANAFAAARSAVQRLRDGDQVSVITYNTAAEVMVAPTEVNAATRARVLAAIKPVRAAGDTCISCGVETGMRLLGRQDGAVSRMLLLSDGEATAGVRDLPGFQRIAEECRSMGASITTIGVDVDYNERILAELARDSNGRHFFVSDPSGLPPVFDQEMQSLADTVATSAELTVDLAPGVFAEHVFDRPAVQRGSQMVVPLGAFAASDRKTLLVRLRVPRGAAGERPVAAVRLHYSDLAEGGEGDCEGQLVAQLSDDPSAIAPLDGLVSARVSSSETAETLEDANQLFRSGRADEARGLIARKREALHATRAKGAPLGPRAADAEKSFARQEQVLESADSGFAQPPAPVAVGGEARPAASPPAADRAGKSQVRSNQKDAFELSE